jgi:hypothetical protein
MREDWMAMGGIVNNRALNSLIAAAFCAAFTTEASADPLTSENNGRASGTVQTDLRGIYVESYSLPSKSADSIAVAHALTMPGVDGMVLVIGWKIIEPAKGHFSWSVLDEWTTIAMAAGKKIELSIREDLNPSWLFQPLPAGGGVTPLTFSFPRRPSDTTCISESLPAPWDSTFLGHWDLMLDSVSEHMKSTGAYDAVVLLRLTGINKDSDELHLPASSSATAACATNSVATWLATGYRPSLLLKGWDGTTDAFKNHFPDKSFSVAIIASTNPFPPIAEDGTVYTDSIPNQSFPLLDLASRKFPGHLVIQNNSLYPYEPAQQQTIQSAESLKTMIAFQTNEDIRGKGAGCGHRGSSDDTTTCTDSTFLAELQSGIYPLGPQSTLRAQYIEVFALNVNATPDAILQAHNELLSSAQSVAESGGIDHLQPLLFVNFPNPFNPTTVVSYQLPGVSDVRLSVFDILGREVAVLVNERKAHGTYEVNFDGSSLASGVYFYRLTAGQFAQTRKMVVIK